MSNPMQDGMAEATRLTREGRLAEATSLIQRTLGGTGLGHSPTFAPPNAPGSTDDPVKATGRAAKETPLPTSSPRQDPTEPLLRRASTLPGRSPRRMPRPHRSTLRTPAGTPGTAPGAAEDLSKPDPSGGRFITRSYTGRDGARNYKLYIPSGYVGQAVPLVVMLHGCTQDPDDFAAGTRMNALAEEQTFLVAYPAQSQSANVSKCWNWFKAADQQCGQGEPSLIAGITREITKEYGIADGRVYVAGMSAGGAMAAIMGAAYPDLYAAVGVHSGLAPGAASDLPSALSAMQRGESGGATPHRNTSTGSFARNVPLIVFHGDRDTTVHPRNADHLLAHYGSASDTSGSRNAADRINPPVTARQGKVPGGYAYTRQARHDTEGRTVMERWTVHGLGHAWSGGNRSGSYTDPNGPDAMAEMVRFFDQHR